MSLTIRLLGILNLLLFPFLFILILKLMQVLIGIFGDTNRTVGWGWDPNSMFSGSVIVLVSLVFVVHCLSFLVFLRYYRGEPILFSSFEKILLWVGVLNGLMMVPIIVIAIYFIGSTI